MNQPANVLTIGGTDPCGAFGAYTDLKTFTALGGHGMGVVTVVTAQNSVGWYGGEFMSPTFVSQQLDAVLSDYLPVAVKTGFLGQVEMIDVVAQKLQEYEVPNIVVDPVMVNNHGRQMFGDDVTAAYLDHLLPLATLITPNVWEAAVLLGHEPQKNLNPKETIQALYQKCHGAVLLKRAIVDDEQIVDLFEGSDGSDQFEINRVNTRNVSGSGDTLSAAIVMGLAQKMGVRGAVQYGQRYTHQALVAARGWRLAQGNGPLAHWAAAQFIE